MRPYLLRWVLLGSILAVSFTTRASPARAAQDAGNGDQHDDDGFDEGLLGLVGLAGLLGLRRRDHDRARTDR